MLWTRWLVLTSCLVFLPTACAHSPHALNDDLSVQQMREEFLLEHPDGQFNAYIAKGEVVRGMNVLEVSASWGIPETRRMSKDRKLEYWTYFSKDEISGDWARYTLTFQERVLTEWDVVRHFNKNGTLTQWSHSSDASATTNPGVSSSDLGPKKR
jgi:hypothetical protein